MGEAEQPVQDETAPLAWEQEDEKDDAMPWENDEEDDEDDDEEYNGKITLFWDAT